MSLVDAEMSRLKSLVRVTERERDAAQDALSAAQAEGQTLRGQLQQAAAFWRPVARDLEHGILSIDSVRFLAQDFLAMLQPPLAAQPAAPKGVIEDPCICGHAHSDHNFDCFFEVSPQVFCPCEMFEPAAPKGDGAHE